MRLAILTAASAVALSVAADASVVTGSRDANFSAQINVGGPRLLSGNIESRFWNVQADGSQFSAFAVADFPTAGLFSEPLVDITSATLLLSQDTAGFSRAGNVIFYLASDTSAITPTTLINFQQSGDPVSPNVGSATVGTQLGTLTEIGQGVYTVLNNNRDSYPLTVSGPALTAMLQTINAGGTLRVVATPGERGTFPDPVAATWSGITPRTGGTPPRQAPTLEIVGVVPEPATLSLLALGGLALRRRRRA